MNELKLLLVADKETSRELVWKASWEKVPLREFKVAFMRGR